MDTTKTGSYLAALRKDAGLTQQETADRLGVSNKTISKWESGGGFPDIAILPALAELYGVTADDILAGETVRRTAASGGGQVEQYLARRGELRCASATPWRHCVCWRRCCSGLTSGCGCCWREPRRRYGSAGADAARTSCGRGF